MKTYKLVVCKQCLTQTSQLPAFLIDGEALTVICTKHGEHSPIQVLSEHEIKS